MLNSEKNRRDALHEHAISLIWFDEEDTDVLNTLFQETGASSNPATLLSIAHSLGVGGSRVNLEYMQELLELTDPAWATPILVDHIPEDNIANTFAALKKFT